MKKYSKDLSTWANNVGRKEALENPHNLIRYVTFTALVTDGQEEEHLVLSLSPGGPLVFRPESTGNKSIPNASRENFIFDFFLCHANDYSKTKPCNNYQLPINLEKENFILFIQRKMSR